MRSSSITACTTRRSTCASSCEVRAFLTSHAGLQTAGRDGRRASVMPNMPSKSWEASSAAFPSATPTRRRLWWSRWAEERDRPRPGALARPGFTPGTAPPAPRSGIGTSHSPVIADSQLSPALFAVPGLFELQPSLTARYAKDSLTDSAHGWSVDVLSPGPSDAIGRGLLWLEEPFSLGKWCRDQLVLQRAARRLGRLRDRSWKAASWSLPCRGSAGSKRVGKHFVRRLMLCVRWMCMLSRSRSPVPRPNQREGVADHPRRATPSP